VLPAPRRMIHRHRNYRDAGHGGKERPVARTYKMSESKSPVAMSDNMEVKNSIREYVALTVSRRHALLACGGCYVAAAISAVLLRPYGSVGELAISAIVSLISLPGLSAAIVYTLNFSYGSGAGGLVAGVVLLGYAVHVALVAMTLATDRWLRCAVFCAFIASLLYDVYNVVTNLWVILPGEW
jgi:hypothetical protein